MAEVFNRQENTHFPTNDLIIRFNKFKDSALNILAIHTWSGTDVKAHLAGMQELNLLIKERFEAGKLGSPSRRRRSI